MDRFPRYRHKEFGLLFSAFAVFMIINAAKRMFPLDLGDGPLGSKIFIVVFLTCWYGLLVAFVLYGLTWLQTIEIDREEIRICFGRFVVRRIPIRQVRSVGMSVQYGKRGISMWELVLSREDRHTLNARGEKYLRRGRARERMKQAGISSEGRDAAARACLLESWKGILLRMEWSEAKENILRQRLSADKFIL